MSGWTEVKDGNITLEHLSTGSLVRMEIVDYSDYDNENGSTRYYFFDYVEFASLCACIEKLLPVLNGPPEEKPKKGPHINFKAPVGFELKFFKNPAIEQGRGLVLVHPDDYESIRKNLKNQ